MILTTFYLTNFQLLKYFLHIVFVGILRFQMWFDVDILSLQIKLQCRYFGIFGHFFQNWANFLNQFSGHTECAAVKSFTKLVCGR
jgi:hypothetical protein